MIPINVTQVRSAADEADYRADHHDNQSSHQRVVHEGYPVQEGGFVQGFDLRRVLRDCRHGRLIKRSGQVQATLRRGREWLVVETTIGHVPLRAHDDPDHRHHRDQPADHRSLGCRPRHQHPQREQTEHSTSGDAGHCQGQLEDVTKTVH